MHGYCPRSADRARSEVRREIVPNFRDSADAGSAVRTVTSKDFPPGPFQFMTGAVGTVASAPGSSVDLPAVSERVMTCFLSDRALSWDLVHAPPATKRIASVHMVTSPRVISHSPRDIAGSLHAPNVLFSTQRHLMARNDTQDNSRAFPVYEE